jgi:hypothetical protein
LIGRLPRRVDEHPRGPWLRGIAAGTALGAGAIHLAQVAVHLEEGWIFAAFFLVVGAVQVIAALLLVRTWPVLWFWFGIAGSAAVIGVWVVSRTIGLPFGPEPGQAEALGTADAAASLSEAITVVALAVWLIDRSGRRRVGDLAAILVVASLGAVWVSTRATGLFDPDPRLTIALPRFADRAVVALVVGVSGMLGLLAAFPLSRPDWWSAVMRGLLAAVVVMSIVLAGMTFPASVAQNAACSYATLAGVGQTSHHAPPPASLDSGEERWFGVLLLSACGPDAVRLESAQVINARGTADVLGYALLPAGDRLDYAGADDVPAYTLALDSKPVLQSGERRELAVRLRGKGERFNLDSVRIGYSVGDEAGGLGFATVLSTCPASDCPAGD